MESLHFGPENQGSDWAEQVGKYLLNPGDNFQESLLRGTITQEQVAPLQRMIEQGLSVAKLTNVALPAPLQELADMPFALRKAWSLQMTQSAVDGGARKEFLSGITGGLGGFLGGAARAGKGIGDRFRRRNNQGGQLN
jgi:hypothetical protein